MTNNFDMIGVFMKDKTFNNLDEHLCCRLKEILTMFEEIQVQPKDLENKLFTNKQQTWHITYIQ